VPPLPSSPNPTVRFFGTFSVVFEQFPFSSLLNYSWTTSSPPSPPYSIPDSSSSLLMSLSTPPPPVLPPLTHLHLSPHSLSLTPLFSQTPSLHLITSFSPLTPLPYLSYSPPPVPPCSTSRSVLHCAPSNSSKFQGIFFVPNPFFFLPNPCPMPLALSYICEFKSKMQSCCYLRMV